MGALSRRSTGPVDWADVRRRMAQAFEATEAQSRPSPERARKALEARAAAIAQAGRINPGAATCLTFTLSDRRYAIETRYICEVVRAGPLSPLPRTPDHVAGVHDLRGHLIPVFDLRVLLGEPAGPVATAIVCGSRQPEFMIAVDTAHGLVGLEPGKLDSEPEKDGGPAWIRGMIGPELTLIDGDALLRDEAFMIESGRGGGRNEP